MTDAQRDFLLSRFRGLAEDAGKDNSPAAKGLEAALAWLEGRHANNEVRPVLEELMAASDAGTGYQEAVFEHEAFANALKSLGSSG